MALIRCPECDLEISDKASACPGCGCPMTPAPDEKQLKLDEARKQDQSFLIKAGIGFLAAILLLLGLVFLLSRGA